MTSKTADQPCDAIHIDERPWETLRWPGQWSKMLFHPRPERPTEPNAGLVRYDPGSHHPWHRHDFAQVRRRQASESPSELPDRSPRRGKNEYGPHGRDSRGGSLLG